MSRIGRKPIEIPSSVSIGLSPGRVQVNGPLGELSQQVPPRMKIEQRDGEIVVERPTERGEDRALHVPARETVDARERRGGADAVTRNQAFRPPAHRPASQPSMPCDRRAIEAALTDGAFGAAGSRLVLEERMTGRETSAQAFTDGVTVVPMVYACDYKRVFDADEGGE